MRKSFEDGSFIEFKIGSPGNVALIIVSRDKDNPLKLIANSVEISLQDFSNLVGGIGLQLPPPAKNEG